MTGMTGVTGMNTGMSGADAKKPKKSKRKSKKTDGDARNSEVFTFAKWADDRNLIVLLVSMLLSLSLNRFIVVFIDNTVTVLVTTFTNLQDLKYRVNDKISIEIGRLAVEFLNMCVVLYISYLIIKYSRRYLGWT